jgi:hypothetical protein
VFRGTVYCWTHSLSAERGLSLCTEWPRLVVIGNWTVLGPLRVLNRAAVSETAAVLTRTFSQVDSCTEWCLCIPFIFSLCSDASITQQSIGFYLIANWGSIRLGVLANGRRHKLARLLFGVDCFLALVLAFRNVSFYDLVHLGADQHN